MNHLGRSLRGKVYSVQIIPVIQTGHRTCKVCVYYCEILSDTEEISQKNKKHFRDVSGIVLLLLGVCVWVCVCFYR